MAFSVFSLAIFGIPLAIQVGRKETYANLAIALIIAMTYYFLIIVVSWLEGKPGLAPGYFDLAAEYHFPVDWLLFDPEGESALIANRDGVTT